MATNSTGFLSKRFRLSERARRNLRRYLGYPLYFLTCFVLFAYCTFPYDRVRETIEAQVAVASPGTELEIVDLSPSWGTGVVLTGVRVRLPPEPGEERPSELALDEVSARVSLLAYMGGTTEISYSATLAGGGTIEGVYAETEEQNRLQATLTEVNLGRIGPIRHYVGLPLGGVATGEIDVTIADDIADTAGDVTLTVSDLTVGDGTAQLQIPRFGGLTIERIVAGDLNLRGQLERGTLRIQQLEARGEDAELRGAGTLNLLRPLRMSRMDLLVRVLLTPAYFDKSDVSRRLQSAIDAPFAQAQIRPYRAADGAFQVRLRGSFVTGIGAIAEGTATMP